MDYDLQTRLAKLPLTGDEQKHIEQIRMDYATELRRLEQEYDQQRAELRKLFADRAEVLIADLEAKYAANTPPGLA